MKRFNVANLAGWLRLRGMKRKLQTASAQPAPAAAKIIPIGDDDGCVCGGVGAATEMSDKTGDVFDWTVTPSDELSSEVEAASSVWDAACAALSTLYTISAVITKEPPDRVS